jgi:predicted RNA-binding Zn ribbon-like protein
MLRMARALHRPGEHDIADLYRHSLSLKPAPAPLSVVQRLVNTRNGLNAYDLLGDLPSARAWLALVIEDRAGHPVKAPPFDEAGLSRLREFREALRALLLAHSTGRTPDEGILSRLRSLGGRSHLRVDFDSSGMAVLTTGSDADAVETEIGDALAAIVAAPADQFRRLKACVNPQCGWAFYDGSRSRSGIWCVMDVCGARHKMSRFRSRSQLP